MEMFTEYKGMELLFGLVLLALIVFFMYLWKTGSMIPGPTHKCNTCPNAKKNAGFEA